MENLAYHFTNDRLRDGQPIPSIGHTLVFKGSIKLCERGYHSSLRPSQALKYAPGNILHLVRFGGEIIMGDDKLVSSERTIIKSFNARHILRRFAADQALSVKHLWEMPSIVEEYLTTLDETKRYAARDAARNAAWAAARDAARYAAWDAARNAAWAAARDAARYAARDAARNAAWAAARDAARYAAWDAARNVISAEFDNRVYAKFERF